jgi:hypothetical protein
MLGRQPTLRRVTPEPQLLGPAQAVAGRPFADPARTRDDLATLARMHAALLAESRTARPRERWEGADGSTHWLVVPDWERLRAARPIAAVGFFGQARPVDHAPIMTLEAAIVSRAGAFDGLLGYHNARLAEGGWGNLVLFDARESALHVRDDRTHREALALTPAHYRSLRLHAATLPEGIAGPLALVRTRYFDFAGDPPWLAVREAS